MPLFLDLHKISHIKNIASILVFVHLILDGCVIIKLIKIEIFKRIVKLSLFIHC